MADITMCVSKNCTLKDKCYRSTAKPSLVWQAYSNFYKENKECNHFYKTNK